MALDSRERFFLTFLAFGFIFFVLFSLQFHEASAMVGLKISKHCTNVRFVSIVKNPLLSIGKLTLFFSKNENR